MAVIKEFTNYDGTEVLYPVTVAQAVYVDQNKTVSQALTEQATIADGTYVKKTGDTMSGALYVSNTANDTAGIASAIESKSFKFGLHVGTGGTNHGIYDFKKSGWVLLGDAQHNWTFNGNASTATSASALSHKTLNATTLDNSSGTFAFSIKNVQWPNSDWVGLQIGDSVDKLQITGNSIGMHWRQNDSGGTNSANWSDWRTIADSSNTQTGDANGQIKIAGVDVPVKGLAALAYKDSLSKSDVGLENVDNTSDINKPISTATQTALDGKQATITGAATTITENNLTASRALISDSSGKLAVSDVTSTELGYLDGVTQAIQTQLNGKQAQLGYTPVNITSGFGQNLSSYASSNDNSISGTVVKYSNTTATGKPTGHDHALFQMAYSDSWKTQLAQDWRTNKAYIRNCNNGTWGDWAELYSTASKPSKSDVGLGNVDNTSDANKPISTATQTALDGKQVTITGAATTITSSDLTASRALISNASGKVVVSDVTSTELGYLDGVTSAIQTQLNAKAPLDSPEFTGTPKAPTATAGTNSTQIATTAFVKTAVDNLINDAPEAYDTLKEISDYISSHNTEYEALLAITSDKQDKITGAATSITQSNLTADRVLISDSSGKVAVSGVTSTELGYLDGVTQAVQAQLNDKQATITGAATTIASDNLTASRVLVSNESGKVGVSTITPTQLGYLNGVTQAIQEQLDGKATSGHNHDQTYLKLSGGTMTGGIKLPENHYHQDGSYGLHLNNSDIVGVNSIYTADASGNAAEGIHFYRDATHYDTIWINGGSILFSPNRLISDATTAANSQRVGRFTTTPAAGHRIVTTSDATGGMEATSLTHVEIVLPAQTAPAVGWYRVAQLTKPTAGYINMLAYLMGNRTTGNSQQMVLALHSFYTSANIFQLSGRVGTIFTQARLVRSGNSTSFYLDLYQAQAYTETQNRPAQYIILHGIGNVTTYTPTEPLETEATASSQVTFVNGTPATKLATQRTIDGVLFDGTANIVHYGTCATKNSTAAKVVACTGFTLATGARINVRFTVTNTAAVGSLTLNVNSTGAIAIKYRNSDLPLPGILEAGRTYTFIYDGTYYQLVGDINTDYNTRQTLSTTDTNYPLLMSSSDTSISTASIDSVVYRNNNIYANPSTGVITASTFNGDLTGNVNGCSIASSVPSNAVFTDTTYTFDEGDNNGQIKVTPSDGTAQNVSVKGLGTLAFRSSLDQQDVGLGNVENKSSATIRGEITSQNVTTALGYTPVNKAGDTMSNSLTLSSGNVVTSTGVVFSGNSTLASQAQVGVNSKSGMMYMYQVGNADGNGNRGIWIASHGTGSGTSVIEVDTNNNTTFRGNLNGGASKVYSTLVNQNDGTANGGCIHFDTSFSNSSSGYYDLRHNDSLGFWYRGGKDSSADGYAIFQIGNATSHVASNGTRGYIRLYGRGANFTHISTEANGANQSVTFPNCSGTVYTTGNLQFVLSGTTLTITTS